MKDKLLEFIMDPAQWEFEIHKGVGKGIRKDQLIQLCDPKTRIVICELIKQSKYEVAPPTIAEIPKDDGTMREVVVNEPVDRIILGIINRGLFKLTPDMVHKNCMAYREKISCGDVVQQIAKEMVDAKPDKDGVIGFKADLSKYFDSVPIEFIDRAFDMAEERIGKSVVIDLLRKYYHSDWYFDKDEEDKRKKKLCKRYQSLKQGCAVASWLADVVLYHIDESLSSMGSYRRYSDDILFIGKNHKTAKGYLDHALQQMGMKLNPKKVEQVKKDKWVKFLGFNIMAGEISMAKSRLKTFQKEIQARTTKAKKTTKKKAINDINKYLYKGDGLHSWASQVLPIITVMEDIQTMNSFIMDCIRAVETGKKRVGGLGCEVGKKKGCVTRGKGKNVKANREKTEPKIEGFMSLMMARNAMLTRVDVYKALVMNL